MATSSQQLLILQVNTNPEHILKLPQTIRFALTQAETAFAEETRK
jgi:hypothetical protein